jgi:hypothetical protein
MRAVHRVWVAFNINKTGEVRLTVIRRIARLTGSDIMSA